MSIHPQLAAAARRAVPSLILAVALLATFGCGATIDMDKAGASISEGITQQMSLPVASVACPSESRPLKAGDVFECTARAKDGGNLIVQVTQTDDQGNVNWTVVRSENLYDMEAAAATIQEGIAEQTGVEATVTCGASRWRTGKPGDTFACEAEDGDGEIQGVVVTVEDDAGAIGWKLR
jgi:hypothetical protein